MVCNYGTKELSWSNLDKCIQNFVCVWASLGNSFGQIFCRFGQVAILLGIFTLIQTGLSNFALAQIVDGSLYIYIYIYIYVHRGSNGFSKRNAEYDAKHFIAYTLA